MDALDKAVLTACVVAALLTVVRGFGPRAAGVVAGLPVINGPAMAWLAHDAGDAFAAGSAVAGVAAGAMLAVFALLYAHVARRAGALAAVMAGLAGAGLVALPVLAASRQWPMAMLLSLACCVGALRALPKRQAAAARAQALQSARALPAASVIATAAAAAAVSVLAAWVGPRWGMFAAGLLASLPIVSASVAMAEHAAGGHAAVSEFLRGYLLGLFGRTAFGSVFALTVVPLGAAVALVLGCAAALAVTGVVTMARFTGFPERSRYHHRDGRDHVVDRACPHG